MELLDEAVQLMTFKKMIEIQRLSIHIVYKLVLNLCMFIISESGVAEKVS